MARTYKRDSRGRFAGGGGSSGRPAAKPAPRGKNRLTRDNSGRITSQGGDGATARGGRLRTASGKQRATQTARIKGGGGKLRGGKGKEQISKSASSRVVTPEKINRTINRAVARRDSLSKVGDLNKKIRRSYATINRANDYLNKLAWKNTKKNTKDQNLALGKAHSIALMSGRPDQSPLYRAVASEMNAMRTSRRSRRR